MTDQNAAALRWLAQSQGAARDIAAGVGWAPRTAGPKLRALELQGLVRRVAVKKATYRTEAKHEWTLTEKGRAMVGPIADARTSLRWPGLWCPTCGRISYDEGGGRACHGEDHQRHDVMRPVWLRVTLDGNRED